MKRFIIISGLILISTVAIRLQTDEERRRYAKLNTESEPTKDTQKNFTSYMSKFHRRYKSSGEYKDRLKEFDKNKKKIDEFNQKEAQNKGFEMEVNQFSDMTDEEKEQYQGIPDMDPPEEDDSTVLAQVEENLPHPLNLAELGIPTYKSWKDEGKDTAPKNQGSCGSCWAFSAISLIESVDAIKRGRSTPLVLSEQQVIDCSRRYCFGCNGGWPQYALDYLLSSGATLQYYYPYKKTQNTCGKFSVYARAYSGKIKIASTEKAHLQALQTAPISVVVDSSFLYYYRGGVILDNDRNNPCFIRLSHAVVMVGYGTDSKYGDYYLVKNSWGTTWGEGGYFRISRAPAPTHSYGACGILKNSYQLPV